MGPSPSGIRLGSRVDLSVCVLAVRVHLVLWCIQEIYAVPGVHNPRTLWGVWTSDGRNAGMGSVLDAVVESSYMFGLSSRIVWSSLWLSHAVRW